MSAITHDLSNVRRKLGERFALPPGAVEHFRVQGYVKIKGVLSPEVLQFYGEAITDRSSG
jgi:hypothetical protein